MPGGYLRLRGGRKKKATNVPSPTGKYRRFFEVRLAQNSADYATSNHFVHWSDGTTSKWKNLSLTNIGYFISDIENVSTAYGFLDSNATPGYAAIAATRDRVVFYNGLGVRGTFNSQNGSHPPFSQVKGSGLRYFGLDAYCPGGSNPTVAFVANGAGNNEILFRRTFYVGLHNTTTQHFSNGVLAGTIESSDPGTTTIIGGVTVSNLDRLSTVYHSGGEANEVKYCFYVTLDSGAVPYLLLAADGSGPLLAARTATSISLDLASIDPNGFLVDVTQEMPTKNHPPRPMSCLCYANGRLYGTPMGGAGSGYSYRSFGYQIEDKDLSAVVFSSSASDSLDRSFTGVPEESWPLGNKKYTPNGEKPLWVAPAMDGTAVLVLTRSGTFLLEETADGLHIWDTISNTSGVWDVRSFVDTPYGYVWFDQRKQLVLLPKNARQLRVISSSYSALLANPVAVTPADFLLDPTNEVDRYQIWIGGGISVCHDFELERSGLPFAYTTTNQDVTAAQSMIDTLGRVHHLLGIGAHLFTQEKDPETGIIPVTDQETNDALTEINGEWSGQWLDMGSPDVRKEFREWTVSGDGAPSVQLADSPLTLSWYGDLGATEYFMPEVARIPQSSTVPDWNAKVSNGHMRYLKFRIRLSGHSADVGASYALGSIVPAMYGCIFASMQTVFGGGQNR